MRLPYVELHVNERAENNVSLKEETLVSTLFGLQINLSQLKQAKSTSDEDRHMIGNLKFMIKGDAPL